MISGKRSFDTLPVMLLLALGAMDCPPARGADTAAPVLTGMTLTPRLVDTACGGAANVSLKITDDSSGFASGSINFGSPDAKTYTVSIAGPVSGSATSGTFQASFPLTGLPAGSWTVQQITLIDASANSHTYSTQDLQTLHFPIAFDVISASDQTAPSLTGLNLVPAAIDTSSASVTVTVKVHVTDSVSGFGGGSVQLTSPTGKSVLASFNLDPTSGTMTDGDFTTSLAFPAFSEPGTWTVTNVTIRDGCGNPTTAGSAASPLPSGSDRTLTVTSVQDKTPPVLTAFDFTPKSATVTSAGVPVTFTFTVTDDLSGFGNINLAKCIDGFARLTSPSSTGKFLKACISKRNSGTSKSGVYEATVTIPAYAEPGNWHVTEVSLQDASGNLMLYGTQLPAGLALNASSGAVSGTPTAAGAFNFTAKVTDNTKPSALVAVKALPGVISGGLGILIGTLPDAVRDTPYFATIGAAGGTPPYSWSTSPLDFPAGLSFSSGTISGTPTDTGTFSFTASVTDSSSPPNRATQAFGLSVLLMTITPTVLPNGAVGASYSAQLSSAGGTSPISWTLSGALPNGLQFDQSTGTISGSPTIGGSFAFALTATDASTPPRTATRSFTIDIGPLAITTIGISNGVAGSRYEAALAAPGGVTPYVWSSGPSLQGLNFPWELAVADANPDRTPPSLAPQAGFDFTPKTISTSSAQAVVTATLHITDDLSGFAGGTGGNSIVEFTSPGHSTVSAPVSATAVSGNAKDGMYRAAITFPALAEAGTWKVSKVQLQDGFGNTMVYDAASLTTLGFPSELRNGTASGTINPTSLDFGNQPTGTESRSKPVVLTSGGTAPLEITAITVTGANASDFIVAESAPLTVPEGTTKVIDIVFKPSAGGARSAVLSLAYGGATLTVPLTGTGQAPNTIVITSFPKSPVFGEDVTFTISVTGDIGGALPNGTVTLTDSGQSIGTATLHSGVGVVTAVGLTTGAHSFTASYSGDGTYNGNVSSATAINVDRAATSVLLSTDKTPSLLGQPATFTASVSPRGATGQVQIFDGTTLIGFADLSGGKAAITASSLALGSHSIVASYAGDTNYKGSTSVALQQQVTRFATLAIAASASPDPVGLGSQLTYTLVIVNKGRTAANNVVVTDVLPDAVRLLFVQPVLPTATCTGATTISCALGTLEPGASTSITIVAATNLAGAITNTASVASTETEASQTPAVTTTTTVRNGFDN